MTNEEFYGDAYASMKMVEHKLLDLLDRYSYAQADGDDIQVVVYCCSRIKSPESMMRKLRQHGLPTDGATALGKLYDAVGVRVICSFGADVYRVVSWLTGQPGIRLLQSKDYIAYPKPNGYRSYHLILEVQDGQGGALPAEVQLRTIAMDCWATLEHQLKYKKKILHEELIREELKRCADEIASTDMSLQAIRDWLKKEDGTE